MNAFEQRRSRRRKKEREGYGWALVIAVLSVLAGMGVAMLLDLVWK